MIAHGSSLARATFGDSWLAFPSVAKAFLDHIQEWKFRTLVQGAGCCLGLKNHLAVWCVVSMLETPF